MAATKKDRVIEETHTIGGFQYDIIHEISSSTFLVRWMVKDSHAACDQVGWLTRVAETPGGARLHLLMHLGGNS